jgi:hypothetical protein
MALILHQVNCIRMYSEVYDKISTPRVERARQMREKLSSALATGLPVQTSIWEVDSYELPTNCLADAIY